MDNDFNLYLDFCERYGLNKNEYRSLQTYYLSLDMDTASESSDLFDELENGSITFQEYRAIRRL